MSQQRLPFSGEPWKANGIFRKGDNIPQPIRTTEFGVLYSADCLEILPLINDSTVDTVFADPPFNLGKTYGTKVDDSRPQEEYLAWCERWIDESIRVLKPGGSFFLYNIPKWNVLLGAYLMKRGLTFRHWIAVSIKFGYPLPGRLYPCHYSLLYYCKGEKPTTFRSIRTPIKTCRHCGGEIRDYGGHREAMNPKGVNLTDVWDDIPPVRHWKFKSKKRKANQLSTKLLTRIVELSTQKGDVVLDPFGGSGTTFDVCERRERHWIGIELENCDVIVERLTTADLEPHDFEDHVEERTW